MLDHLVESQLSCLLGTVAATKVTQSSLIFAGNAMNLNKRSRSTSNDSHADISDVDIRPSKRLLIDALGKSAASALHSPHSLHLPALDRLDDVGQASPLDFSSSTISSSSLLTPLPPAFDEGDTTKDSGALNLSLDAKDGFSGQSRMLPTHLSGSQTDNLFSGDSAGVSLPPLLRRPILTEKGDRGECWVY